MSWILLFFKATFITTIVAYIWLLISRRFGIMDKPWKYPDLPKRDAVPTVQWLFLILAVIINIFLFIGSYWHFQEVQSLFLGGIFLAVIALIDEYRWISPKVRIWVMLCVAWIWIAWWAMLTHFSIFWTSFEFPLWLSILISVVWIVGIINAINWFDGINGMASGISTIWFLTIILLIKLVVLKYYVDIPHEEFLKLITITNLCIIFLSVSFVYTFVESKPIWLLRDVWVMFLGYALAYLSLLGWAKVWLILVVLSLVIFDAIWVFLNRIKNKISPLKWDYTHLHHRLLANWWTRWEIRSFAWIWSAFMMILMILQGTDRYGKLIIFLLVFCIFFWVNIYLFWVKKLPSSIKWKKVSN